MRWRVDACATQCDSYIDTYILRRVNARRIARDRPFTSLPPITPQSSQTTVPSLTRDTTVHWNYGSGKPTGEVAEVVTEGEAKVVSKKGNEIKKNADPENPAVKLSRPGNDVVKRASELEIDEKGDKAAKDAPAEKEEEEAAAPAENGADEAKTGEKRKADDEGAEDEEKKDDEDEEPAAAAKGKKQKTAKAASATNGEKKDKAEPKKKGRPAAKEKENGGAEKKDTKAKRAPKKAATESGEPRRSGRNAK